MASYQVRQRDPLLDQGTQAMLEKRGRELLGLFLVVLAFAFVLMLGSYSPEDPGWMVASDKPIANTLGSYGAAIASTLIIIGGMKSGIFTPTEAGVAACVYAFVIGVFVYRELAWRDLYRLFVQAAKTTAVVVFMIAAALVSAFLITTSAVPQQVADMLAPFIGQPILLMFVIMVLIVIIGTALDFAPTLMILTPVLMPVIKQAGIDPIYFGVLFIINNSIGLITPPVGIVLNVVCGISKISMSELMKGLWPFLIAELIVLFLLVLFPSLVLVPLKWLM